MIEVYHNLFVGSTSDYKLIPAKDTGWAVVQACKEPFHREAVGYKSQAAPKDHPEYLIAYRKHPERIVLNLVDADKREYIPDKVMDAACNFIDKHIGTRRVLVHCNQGGSRAPGIAMLWMGKNGHLSHNHGEAYHEFQQKYPAFDPRDGIRAYLIAKWPND